MAPSAVGSSAKAKAAATSSQDRWLSDLAQLRINAKARFGDVCWTTEDGSQTVFAHKAILYSRAAGSFQQRYLAPPQDLNESTLSLPGHALSSRRSITPTTSASHDYSERQSSNDHSQFLRSPSPTSMISVATTIGQPLSLAGTDPALFETCLEYLYTGEKGSESVTVLFDGFGEGVRESEAELSGIPKLREDLLYCWRSKLYADVSLSLDDDSNTTFASHRAILASRVPYFQSLLLGSYSDSRLNHFTLPSPPFTSASLTFVLGYIYAGTLQFSSRKFDLATSFEIWRCAAFLSLSLLQVEVEVRIEEMSTPQRAARIYHFALAPDVNSQRLSQTILPVVVGNFSDVWGCPHIGNLEYDAQKTLVREVCAGITNETVTSIAKKTLNLRKRLELEKAAWASHVRSMLVAIEDELVSVLARSLPSVVVSAGFVDLVDGVGFSTDVLEWILELVVRGLKESKAPEVYQALVGSVLLREDGILIDAKVLVEDARNGILKYVKRKWIGIRSVRGFDPLESWCLKELSDEIEVSVDDLVAATPKSPFTTSRTGLRPAPSKSESALSSSTLENNRPSPPFAQPRPPSSASNATSSTRAPRLSSASDAIVSTRAPRLSTASTASRISTTTTASRATATTAASGLSGASTLPARGTGPSLRGARGGTRVGSVARGTRPPPAKDAAPITTRAESASTSAVTAPVATPSKPSRPPSITPTGLSANPLPSSTPKPAPSLVAGSSTASLTPTSAAVLAQAGGSKPNGAGSAANGVSLKTNGSGSKARIGAASNTKRPPSLAPTVASQRSNSSAISTATAARPSDTRTPTQPRTPTSTRPRTSSTATSGAPKPRPLPNKEKAVISVSTRTEPTARRPSSVASTKSTTNTLRRPQSTTSISSVRAPLPTTSRPSSVSSAKSTRSIVPKAGAPVLKSPAKVSGASFARPVPRSPAAAAGKGAIDRPPLPTKSATGLPGTTLLSGIPCIVTVPSDRPSRFRAVVRYIGGVLWDEGQWVGVEVADSAIPAEARELAWNDGDVDGVEYFKIAPSSGRGTPTPTHGDPSETRPSGGNTGGGSGLSLLRPPSRRQRRSSSSEPVGESGPRKGLFVRPNQIVYVL